MYTKYFGLNEKPFTLTPNPRFIFLSKNHKEAFAHLLYGINNHYGFIELIGEVGTGKTTVLRTLLNQLQEENYRTALIFNPCLTGVELLRSINHEFGINSESEYANELLVDLNKFLLNETTEGRTVVLVIDEAQNLEPDVLEQIRLISNLETDNDKLIQIILAGQPELGALLERPELRQLNQRIAVRYRLKSMSMNESRSYIRHRMEVAGETGGVSFTLLAIRLIYLYTRGVPRMINILCDRSLLIAYGDERRRISSGIVTRAIREILNIPQGRRLSLMFAGLLLFIVILSVLLSAGVRGWTSGKRIEKPQPQPASSTQKAQTSSPPIQVTKQSPKTEKPVPVPTTQDRQFLKLKEEILSFDQDDTHLVAFNSIAECWGVRPIKVFSGLLTVPTMFSRLAAKRNLRVTVFKGTVDEVLRFDIPFLVVSKVADGSEPYCFAVSSVKDNAVTVSPQLSDNATILKNDLKLIATDTFYLVWHNSGQIPEKIKIGDKSFEIRTLQTLLKNAGKYSGTIDGSYNTTTAKAVADFQKASGIPQLESVGDLTLAALLKYYAGKKIPSLSSAGSKK